MPLATDFSGSFIRKNINGLKNNLNNLNDADVVDPTKWSDGQHRHSNTLFGYAISSGYFEINKKKKLLYVASAPKERNELDSDGTVYIFDIVTNTSGSWLEVYVKFESTNLGEYFGYSILAEDFDGDNLTDIVISAPFNFDAKQNIYNYAQGVVYIYKNLGGTSLKFTLAAVLEPDSFKSHSRFGTTLSNVGDLNGDNFNGKFYSMIN